MEINGINPELNDMLLRGQLSGRKIAELVRLKETVDQFAQTMYVPGKEMAELKERFGVEPNIQSWGDYFQTEIASQYFQVEDVEFIRLVDTVRFDLISAIKIFQGKPEEYCRSIQAQGLTSFGTQRENWDRSHEEDAHMYILLQYFQEMGLAQCQLSVEDESWFEGFMDIESRQAIG